jgi:hypothetical protein
MAANAETTIKTQIKAIEMRAQRRLAAGVDAEIEQDFQALIEGCQAADALIDEMPSITQRFLSLSDDPIIYDGPMENGPSGDGRDGG